MAKITEAQPTGRSFTITVTEQELQFIQRALNADNTNNDENGELYGVVTDYMTDENIPRIWP